MQCPSCDADVADRANFCPYCGHHVAASAGPATGSGSDAASTQGSGSTTASPGGTEDETSALHRSGDPTTRLRPSDDEHPSSRGEGTRPHSDETERTPRTDVRTCPRCGAINGPLRVRCGRCDADLETGRAAPVATVHAAEDHDEDEEGTRRQRSRPLAIVLVLAAIVGVVLGVWLLTRTAEERDAPAFDAGVYPGEPTTLDVAGVSADPVREPEDDRRYEAAALVDGDPTTAWATPDGEGTGASFVLRLDEPSWIAAISIHNGDQSDGEAFTASGRVGRLLVRVADATYELDVLVTSGEQAVTLPEPELAQRVEVEVLEATPDDREGIRLSEVALRGWVAVGADAEPRR